MLKEAHKGEPLAIEFALSKLFYIPASSVSEKANYIVITVPTEKQTERSNAVSAIRLEPRMEGDKVRVTVYALRGDVNKIITCKDWDALKSNMVGTYLVGLDETVQLIKLKDYGVVVGDHPISFRVVPRNSLSTLSRHTRGRMRVRVVRRFNLLPESGLLLELRNMRPGLLQRDEFACAREQWCYECHEANCIWLKDKTMEIEEGISKIERVSVRLALLIILVLGLLAVLCYASVELVKFISHQLGSLS